MTTILIVDDDKNFLLSFVDGLKAQDDQLHVLTAENGAQAIDKLKSEPIDLVMTDLKMPVMDGFELLAEMSRSFPRVPVIVVTAFGTPEIEKKIGALGGFQYLEKPLDFSVTLERIYEGLEAKSGGYICGVSLPSFLQLMEVEKKTCQLSVRSMGRFGTLYFHEGELIDAETNEEGGETAALEIASWDEPEIEIVAKFKNRTTQIRSSLHYILMESCRIRDERDKGGVLIGTDFLVPDEPASPGDGDGGGIAEESPRISEVPDKTTIQHKESPMNVQKLNEAMEEMKANVGPGLLSSSIVSSSDGQAIIHYQDNPRASALFTQLTTYLTRALKESGLPELGRYYIIDMTSNQTCIVIPLGDFWWGIFVDTQRSPLGLLLNIAIPRAIEVFEEAIVG